MTQPHEQRCTDTDIERWKRVCRSEAPYPMNYLPESNPVLGAMVGMLIEKEIFMIGFPKEEASWQKK